MRRPHLALALLVAAACGGASSGHASQTAAPTVVARIRTGYKPCGSVAYRGSLYVVTYGAGTIVRIDPRRNRVTRRARLGPRPCGLVSGGGALWIDGFGGDTIDKFDPRRFRVVRRIHVGSQPYDVAYAAGSVWSSNFGGFAVWRLRAG